MPLEETMMWRNAFHKKIDSVAIPRGENHGISFASCRITELLVYESRINGAFSVFARELFFDSLKGRKSSCEILVATRVPRDAIRNIAKISPDEADALSCEFAGYFYDNLKGRYVTRNIPPFEERCALYTKRINSFLRIKEVEAKCARIQARYPRQRQDPSLG